MTEIVKASIEEIIEDYHIMKPKRIHIKLTKWSNSESKRIKVDILPTLSQVQQHIRYKRTLFGMLFDIDL